MLTGEPKGKYYPAVQVGCVVMVLMKKVRETIGGQRMKFLEHWKMIFLRLNPGTRSYTIMKLTCQTDGVTVVIKSYTLKNLKQTVISRILPMEKKHLPR
uniref:NKAP domain containing 1 n=1 Tax=Rousettus aegyptiacus TaxID=9407 RepID=A0A7J8H350_ROUAE|nr:NKAP domain containing 1 [Rousettus aegyptiacus]